MTELDKKIQKLSELGATAGECPMCGRDHQKLLQRIEAGEHISVGTAMFELLEHDLWEINRQSWPLSELGTPEFFDPVFEQVQP